MDKFHRFFIEYMGADTALIEAGQQVFPSIVRVEPETPNSFQYHHLIAAVYNGNLIHSVAPSLLPDYRETAPLDITEDLQQRVDDAFSSVYNGKYYQIRTMRRYSTEKHFDPSPAVTVLGEEHKDLILGRMKHRGPQVREKYWRGTIAGMLGEGRMLAIVENGVELAHSNLTDLPFGAANIEIWTRTDHRRKGHAAALVRRAVNWCHENGKVPVYLVHELNEPSIKLAESIGLERMTSEIQTVVVRN